MYVVIYAAIYAAIYAVTYVVIYVVISTVWWVKGVQIALDITLNLWSVKLRGTSDKEMKVYEEVIKCVMWTQKQTQTLLTTYIHSITFCYYRVI